jgi:hypothetical protein
MVVTLLELANAVHPARSAWSAEHMRQRARRVFAALEVQPSSQQSAISRTMSLSEMTAIGD